MGKYHVHLWNVTSWRTDFPNRGGEATLTCEGCGLEVDVVPAVSASLDLGEAQGEIKNLREELASLKDPTRGHHPNQFGQCVVCGGRFPCAVVLEGA